MNKIYVKGPNEEVFYEVLDNGLTVYMLPNNKVKTYYLTFSAKFGSVYTEFKLEGDKSYTKIPNGVAHFLEHLTFILKMEMHQLSMLIMALKVMHIHQLI